MGKTGSIILIIVVSLALLGIIAGTYFYNFFVFKTLRICVTNNIEDSEFSCTTNEECYDYYKEDLDIDPSLPDFIVSKIDEVFLIAVYCEETCKMREVYGDGTGDEIGSVESCKEGEEEIIIEIKGEEGLKILKFIKDNMDDL